MEIMKILFELPCHLANLPKVLLIQSWAIMLLLVSLLQESEVCQSDGSLECCAPKASSVHRHVDLINWSYHCDFPGRSIPASLRSHLPRCIVWLAQC